MKLALAQISMTSNMQENLEKSLLFCDQADGTDLLFFPEIQLSPFFPQYEKRNVDCYCLQPDSVEISKLKEKAAQHHYYLSPNVYLERQGKRYDTSPVDHTRWTVSRYCANGSYCTGKTVL